MYDTLEMLRPKLHICTSWDDASQAADALDKEFASKLGKMLGHLYSLVHGGDVGDDNNAKINNIDVNI